jgi:hypothetical protein
LKLSTTAKFLAALGLGLSLTSPVAAQITGPRPAGGVVTTPLLAPPATNCAAVPFSFQGDTNTGVCSPVDGQVAIYSNGSESSRFGSASDPYRFALGNDAVLTRDNAANVIGQRSGTSAQRWNVYNTYTSSTNNEAFSVDWQTVANLVMIGTRTAATGNARGMRLVVQENNAAATGSFIEITRSSTPMIKMGYGTLTTGAAANWIAGNDPIVSLGHGVNVSSTGNSVNVQVESAINQSGTAGSTDFLLKRTETTVGSGTQNLFDAQVGGVSRFALRNTGELVQLQAAAGGTVHSLSSIATNDDPIERFVQNRVATTDATVTTIQSFTVPTSTTVGVYCAIQNRRTGGASGSAEDAAYYELRVVVKNTAGTVAEIAPETVTVIGESQAAWTVSSAPSGATLLVQVTGAAGNNITWHSQCRLWSLST